MSSEGIYTRCREGEFSNSSIRPPTSSLLPIENCMAFGSQRAGSSVLQMIMHLFSIYILRISMESDLFWLSLHDMCLPLKFDRANIDRRNEKII